MFEKILIATDLSPAADCLVQCAAELKAIGLKQAVLAHVVYVANTPGLEDLLMEKAGPRLEHQKSLLEEQGIEVVTAMELGMPAYDLDILAERHDVATILIGSRGHGLARSALGGVSFKL
ncbi:MAG: universal stress protein, partial [Thermoleophilia bacterium]|nr:universal stress protein [Thermoleophilia bacterium]